MIKNYCYTDVMAVNKSDAEKNEGKCCSLINYHI